MHTSEEIFNYIEEGDLGTHLRRLHPGMVITHDRYESLVPGFLNDLEWNGFDEYHRIFVHDTYHDFFKVFNTKMVSVNLVRWKQTPIFLQVANARIRPGLFYQSISILGVVYVHQLVSYEPRGEEIFLSRRWYTASHWSFRWLHPLINWRLRKLNKVQDDEDNELMRPQRYELRKRGFRFDTDVPDFFNSNDFGNHVIPPPLEAPVRIPLAGIPQGRYERVQAGPIALLVRRTGDAIDVLPGICPHEGAPLDTSHDCGGALKCPWHGLKFHAVQLSPTGRRSWSFLGLSIRVEADGLVVEQKDELGQTAPRRRAGVGSRP